MEIKGKDGYKIEMNHALSFAQIKALMVCYQACIGPTAAALYLTLVSEAENQRSFDLHQRLCALMGIDIVAFELARVKCEEVNLIATWHQKQESRDNYLYVLNPPLTCEQFLAHDVLGRRYMQIVGAKMAEATQIKAVRPMLEKNGFTNISKRFNPSVLETWNHDDEVKFTKVKPAYTVKKAMDPHIDFDYDAFLQESTNLSFPIEARTHEALQVIGELATIYGISPDRMRILVGHSVNNSTNVLDIQKLKRLASYEKPKEKKSRNPYDVSPVYFLQNRQGGIPVTQADARLLEMLISELKMRHEVVNVLIESVLNQNENRLSSSYVQKVAATWVRNKIDTVEKAQAAVQQGSQVKKTPVIRKAVLPKDFSENTKERVSEEEKKISEEKLKELKERMKRLEG